MPSFRVRPGDILTARLSSARLSSVHCPLSVRCTLSCSPRDFLPRLLSLRTQPGDRLRDFLQRAPSLCTRPPHRASCFHFFWDQARVTLFPCSGYNRHSPYLTGVLLHLLFLHDLPLHARSSLCAVLRLVSMAATSSQSGATSSSVPSGESGAPKLESSPAPGIFDFTDADFLDKPLSHKVTHLLPPVPESMRLNGPNFLKWQRFVETTLRSRQLFKHCTGMPLTATHPHYAAWDTEEHFILGWFVTHSLTPEFHDRFPHQKTIKGFWDQAHHFCGRGGDYWMLFSMISRAHALRQGSLSISEYALAY